MGAPPPDWLRIGAGSLSVQIIARPGSSRRGVAGMGPRGLVIAVHAPADEGRANAELIEVLAEAASVARSSITTQCGVRGRSKLIRVESPNPVGLAARILGLARSLPGEQNKKASG